MDSDTAPPMTAAAFGSFQQALIRSCYRVLLGREPEESITAKFTAPDVPQSQEREIHRIINAVFSSPEFRDRMKFIGREVIEHPNKKALSDVFCFIHMMKTGGTTLDNAIAEAVDPKRQGRNILRPRNQKLFLYSPGELAGYKFISGHIDYASSLYIPAGKVIRFSIFRDPIERLISLYRYSRAYNPKMQQGVNRITLANDLSPEDFFKHPDIRNSDEFDNTYLHAFGATLWDGTLPKGAARDAAFKLAWERIAGLEAVGLTNRMAESLAMIFRVLGLQAPATFRSMNDSENFGKTMPDLKPVPMVPITPSLREAVADLIDYDMELYRLAEARFNYIHRTLG